MAGRAITRRKLAGEKYGNWTVVKEAPDRRAGNNRLIKSWFCVCGLCGKTYKVNEQSLISAHSWSCKQCSLKKKGFIT